MDLLRFAAECSSHYDNPYECFHGPRRLGIRLSSDVVFDMSNTVRGQSQICNRLLGFNCWFVGDITA